MPEENESLSDVLTDTETPAPAASGEQAETEQTADSSLTQQAESAEQPKTEPEGIDKVRAWGKGLETDLNTLRGQIDGYGGESHLSIMKPVLELTQEVPMSQPELEAWGDKAWQTFSQVMSPEQTKQLADAAAWSYLTDPQSAAVISESLYGVTPEVLRTLTSLYKQDPEGVMAVLRPNETFEQRQMRERYEAAEAERNQREAQRDAQFKQIENERQAFQSQQVMGEVYKGLNARAEVKKQFGLEFEKKANDTPEIAAFKERASARYDRMIQSALSSDSELNRLANQAEYLAKQVHPQMRQRAVDQFAPLIEQRTRKVCAEIAKDLVADWSLLAPGFSDRTKADNLKDLPAQLGSAGAAQPGHEVQPLYDASGRPNEKLAQQIRDFMNQQSRPALPAG